MNKILLLAVTILISQSVVAQKNVKRLSDLFTASAMNADSKVITSIRGEYDGDILWEETEYKPRRKVMYEWLEAEISPYLNIDYQKDTIYIIEQRSLLNDFSYMLISNYGRISFVLEENRVLNFERSNWDPLVIEAVLKWDKEYIYELVQKYGGYAEDAPWNFAWRFIIKDNKLVSREIIMFDCIIGPDIRWFHQFPEKKN